MMVLLQCWLASQMNRKEECVMITKPSHPASAKLLHKEGWREEGGDQQAKTKNQRSQVHHGVGFKKSALQALQEMRKFASEKVGTLQECTLDTKFCGPKE